MKFVKKKNKALIFLTPKRSEIIKSEDIQQLIASRSF